MFSIEKSTGCF